MKMTTIKYKGQIYYVTTKGKEFNHAQDVNGNFVTDFNTNHALALLALTNFKTL